LPGCRSVPKVSRTSREVVITVLSEIRMLEEKSEGNKPLENLQVEGILEKLKIVPEPRNPEIRLDKPVTTSTLPGCRSVPKVSRTSREVVITVLSEIRMLEGRF
jgi:hypothetical protein